VTLCPRPEVAIGEEAARLTSVSAGRLSLLRAGWENLKSQAFALRGGGLSDILGRLEEDPTGLPDATTLPQMQQPPV